MSRWDALLHPVFVVVAHAADCVVPLFWGAVTGFLVGGMAGALAAVIR